MPIDVFSNVQVDPVSFRTGLAQGDRDIVYALLKWILSQVPVLQQRAVIGFYLAMPDVPPEFRTITDIQVLL